MRSLALSALLLAASVGIAATPTQPPPPVQQNDALEAHTLLATLQAPDGSFSVMVQRGSLGCPKDQYRGVIFLTEFRAIYTACVFFKKDSVVISTEDGAKFEMNTKFDAPVPPPKPKSNVPMA